MLDFAVKMQIGRSCYNFKKFALTGCLHVLDVLQSVPEQESAYERLISVVLG